MGWSKAHTEFETVNSKFSFKNEGDKTKGSFVGVNRGSSSSPTRLEDCADMKLVEWDGL